MWIKMTYTILFPLLCCLGQQSNYIFALLVDRHNLSRCILASKVVCLCIKRCILGIYYVINWSDNSLLGITEICIHNVHSILGQFSVYLQHTYLILFSYLRVKPTWSYVPQDRDLWWIFWKKLMNFRFSNSEKFLKKDCGYWFLRRDTVLCIKHVLFLELYLCKYA